MSRHTLIYFAWLLVLCTGLSAHAQQYEPFGNEKMPTQQGDTTKTKDVPYGFYGWKIDSRFGQIVAAEPDTTMAYFPQKIFTCGPTMRYNFTGNSGSPRVSRIYDGTVESSMQEQFIFSHPYDYFITNTSELFFSNTKSPYTNLFYSKGGNKQNGEDRIVAQFAVNAGKKLGMGFKVDYLYGRGYYQYQSNSSLGATVYASYLSERYNLHTYYGYNKIRNTENGGLEEDMYVTSPELLPTSYRMSEMPVRMEDAFNYTNYNNYYLTHNYNIGHDHIVRYDTIRTPAAELEDSVKTDTIRIEPRYKFIPVAAIIHTLKIGHHNRSFLSHSANNNYFSDNYFEPLGLPSNEANDRTRNFTVQNTLALEMREGFRPWVKSGMRVFAKHDFEHYVLLDKHQLRESYNENYVSLGAQLFRAQGRLFHYDVLGEFRTTGKKWGEFNVDATLKFDIPLKRDSLTIEAKGVVRNELPAFYYRHYHSRNAWWDDENLGKIFRTRAEGTIAWRGTRVSASFEDVSNYTHFANRVVFKPDVVALESRTQLPLYGVDVVQADRHIQVFTASLRQDFKFGPLCWDIEATVQKSTDEDHLPLPVFTGYTNVYLKFKIAHILSTELGADARYFTKYHAPDYNPAIGMYATQSEASHTKIGNYPWVNVYANLHLKRARIFVMYTHVNYTSGRYFLTPHYPTNQRVLRLGVSWTFVN